MRKRVVRKRYQSGNLYPGVTFNVSTKRYHVFLYDNGVKTTVATSFSSLEACQIAQRARAEAGQVDFPLPSPEVCEAEDLKKYGGPTPTLQWKKKEWTQEELDFIRSSHLTNPELGKMFGVSRTTIGRIRLKQDRYRSK